MEDFFYETYRRVRREIARIMEEMEEEFQRLFSSFEHARGYVEPLTCVYETPDELVISVDLPLVKKEDIKVEVSDNVLTIEARTHHEYVYHVENPFFRECKLTCYRKSIELPPNVDVKNIKAKFRDGVLEIRIPKKRKGIRIEVE